MATVSGKFEEKVTRRPGGLPFPVVPLSLFLIEFFAFLYLQEEEAWWPLAFGGLWSVILAGVLRLLNRKVSRIAYGVLYGAMLVYAVGQTGYYLLFSEMMWLSEFLYASEGSDYFDILTTYPVQWFVWVLGLLALGAVTVWKYPRQSKAAWPRVLAGLMALLAALYCSILPEKVFEKDSAIRYAGSDYGRAQSAEAAYDNMFNAYRLYQVCGLYQMAAKDIYANTVYPITPAYAAAHREGIKEIDSYFASEAQTENEMTGLLAGKNVVLVLMESMDDWMIGEHTPTLENADGGGDQFYEFLYPALWRHPHLQYGVLHQHRLLSVQSGRLCL